ncbi:XRE family transcriptional regulator [Vagococcus carniphilus]|uniref:XRE family transcriptional regulator n=1 Tax=Vagococcus carniphilus TaxID=218144 RepID=UPI00288E0502|nr:XRE family transcriptional regulator [Vagococcus carniphilus]MDT2849029.1 XRE family transcriptional regulator [Vagococcus carniphilus]
MPDNDLRREKELKYIEENNISLADLGVMYGINKQDVTNYFKGHLVGRPKSNQLIIRIISDFKIR